MESGCKMEILSSTRPDVLIDQATLNRATACKRNFSCLSNGTCSSCQVFACVDDTLIVRCNAEGPCDYRVEANGRQKIFAKYGS